MFAVILILAFSVCAVDEIGNITYAPSAGGDPNVCIVSDVKMPVLTAGESAVLSIPVRTASIYTAFDVIGNVSSPDGKLPFELENLSPFSKPITIFFDIDSPSINTPQ